MKSVLLSFALFIAIFGILKSDITALIDNSLFPIISLIVLLFVICLAVLMFGLPTKTDILRALKIKNKETDNEKDK